MPVRSAFLGGIGATAVAATTPNLTPMAPSITIAVCAPFSGGARPIGNRPAKGVQAAIDANNELANTLSQTYYMRTFDDQNQVANATLQASFATADNTVLAAIGHVSSDATLKAIPTYGSAALPLIVPLCTDDRVTATQYHCIFRLPTKDTFEGQLFARTVIETYKPKLPYVFVQDADYGADVANGYIGAMQRNKIDVRYQQFPYANADFGKVVDVALAVQPDHAFLAGIVADMGPLVGVLRAKGYTGPIGASQGFFDPDTAKLGPAANGMMISTSMPYLPFAPATVRWRQEFEQHNGALDPVAAFGYAAAQLIINTVSRSHATTRFSLISAIAQGVPMDTMVGTYAFNSFGDAIDPQIYYYTLKDGTFSYLHEAHRSPFMIK